MRFSVFICSIASAQSFYGTLRGRVLDPQGAAATATVTLTDEGKSTTRKTVTNDQGEYTFASLTPSTYTVAIAAPGFRRSEHRGVIVATQAVATLDVTLDLGDVTEQINVTAEAPACSRPPTRPPAS